VDRAILWALAVVPIAFILASVLALAMSRTRRQVPWKRIVRKTVKTMLPGGIVSALQCAEQFLLHEIQKAKAGLHSAGRDRKAIAVDLSTYSPPTPNGIDAVTVCGWLRALAECQPRWRWILLTSPANHRLFRVLESKSMRRRVTPSKTLLRKLGARALFCPFGATDYRDCNLPAVVLWNGFTRVNDGNVKHSRMQITNKDAFAKALRVADKLVCFSVKSRAEILTTERPDPRRVVALRIPTVPHWPHLAPADLGAALNQHGLRVGDYLYCPCEFSEENNLKLLLVAVGMFCAHEPQTQLQIVCCGPATKQVAELDEASALMGVQGNFVFVPTDCVDEQAALLQGCRAVLIPALAGAQAVLLLQAVALHKPLFCSEMAAVPETARVAAFLFDPKKPSDLVKVLRQAASDDQLLAQLIQRSHEQSKRLGGPREVAGQFAEIFQEVMAASLPAEAARVAADAA
jgi:glycosyltransferase involved in cell wall biosynthesis